MRGGGGEGGNSSSSSSSIRDRLGSVIVRGGEGKSTIACWQGVVVGPCPAYLPAAVWGERGASVPGLVVFGGARPHSCICTPTYVMHEGVLCIVWLLSGLCAPSKRQIERDSHYLTAYVYRSSTSIR